MSAIHARTAARPKVPKLVVRKRGGGFCALDRALGLENKCIVTTGQKLPKSAEVKFPFRGLRIRSLGMPKERKQSKNPIRFFNRRRSESGDQTTVFRL